MLEYVNRNRGCLTTLEAGSDGRRLLFLQHGMHGRKEDVMEVFAPALVAAGFHVVALDAKLHGERLEEPFVSGTEIERHLATPRIVEKTAEDIVRVYETAFAQRYEAGFDLVGVSMGGMIAYRVAAVCEAVRDLAALISTPDFIDAAERMVPPHLRKGSADEKAALEAVAALDPRRSARTLHYRRLLMLNTKDDEVIPHEASEAFASENAGSDIVFRLHEGGHDVSEAMVEDLVNWLSER